MTPPVSPRLTDMRDLESEDEKRIRKARIRAQSESVGRYVAVSPEASEFYADWGMTGLEP